MKRFSGQWRSSKCQCWPNQTDHFTKIYKSKIIELHDYEMFSRLVRGIDGHSVYYIFRACMQWFDMQIELTRFLFCVLKTDEGGGRACCIVQTFFHAGNLFIFLYGLCHCLIFFLNFYPHIFVINTCTTQGNTSNICFKRKTMHKKEENKRHILLQNEFTKKIGSLPSHTDYPTSHR